ncbi:MAG: hypothetical protein Q9204_004320 [Flavoplaca sp. TL-2023a]
MSARFAAGEKGHLGPHFEEACQDDSKVHASGHNGCQKSPRDYKAGAVSRESDPSGKQSPRDYKAGAVSHESDPSGKKSPRDYKQSGFGRKGYYREEKSLRDYKPGEKGLRRKDDEMIGNRGDYYRSSRRGDDYYRPEQRNDGYHRPSRSGYNRSRSPNRDYNRVHRDSSRRRDEYFQDRIQAPVRNAYREVGRRVKREISRMTDSEAIMVSDPNIARKRGAMNGKTKVMHKACEKIFECWLDAQLRSLYPGREVEWYIPLPTVTHFRVNSGLSFEEAGEINKAATTAEPKRFMKWPIQAETLAAFWQKEGYRTVPPIDMWPIQQKTVQKHDAVVPTDIMPSSDKNEDCQPTISSQIDPPENIVVEQVPIQEIRPQESIVDHDSAHDPISKDLQEITEASNNDLNVPVNETEQDAQPYVSKAGDSDPTVADDTTLHDGMFDDSMNTYEGDTLATGVSDDPIIVDESQPAPQMRLSGTDLERYHRFRSRTQDEVNKAMTKFEDLLAVKQLHYLLVGSMGAMITHHTMLSLYEGEWLDDCVITAYTGLVVDPREDIEMIDTVVMTSSMAIVQSNSDGKKDPYDMYAALAPFNQRLTDKTRTLIMPLHVNNNHWVLCIATWHGAKGTLRWFNSMESLGDMAMEVYKVKLCLEWAGMLEGSVLTNIDWHCDRNNHSRHQQKNSSDCGLYVLANLVVSVYGTPWDGSLEGYRRHIAWMLLKSTERILGLEDLAYLPNKVTSENISSSSDVVQAKNLPVITNVVREELLPEEVLVCCDDPSVLDNGHIVGDVPMTAPPVADQVIKNCSSVSSEALFCSGGEAMTKTDDESDESLCLHKGAVCEPQNQADFEAYQRELELIGSHSKPTKDEDERCGFCTLNGLNCDIATQDPCSNCQKNERRVCRPCNEEDRLRRDARHRRNNDRGREVGKIIRHSRHPQYWTRALRASAIDRGLARKEAKKFRKLELLRWLVDDGWQVEADNTEDFGIIIDESESEYPEEWDEIEWPLEALKHEICRRGADVVNESREAYVAWLEEDRKTREERKTLFINTMRWSPSTVEVRGDDAEDEAYQVMRKLTQEFLIHVDRDIWPNLYAADGLLLKWQLGVDVVPTLQSYIDGELQMGTCEYSLIQSLASINEGGRVVLQITGSEGFVATQDDWRAFADDWRHLNIEIAVCQIYQTSYPDLYSHWQHVRFQGRKARLWHVFSLERLLHVWEGTIEDALYQEWISEMEREYSWRRLEDVKNDPRRRNPRLVEFE